MDGAPVQQIVVVSNRGPVAFAHDEDGSLVTKRGGGGLVSALGPALAGRSALWVAGAISDADRDAAARGRVQAEGFDLRLLAIDAVAYRAFYDVVANSTLWYLHHGLFDRVRRPALDRHWREAWQHYRAVNEAFAAQVCEAAPEGATVLVQDYHLALVAAHLAKERPDLRAVHFTHTPFCGPQDLRVLPDDVAIELLRGMAASRACGFHSARWAAAFEACCREVLDETPPTFVAPAAPDLDDVRGVAASEACETALQRLDDAVGDRAVIARVDRIELSKNIVRGFLAFDELLETRPEWRGRVVFAASVYPSRQTLADYLAYASEVEATAARVNARWATDGWTPILLDTSDDFPASVAALRRYDVLLVNPVRDGLNLVAKEGPSVNERDGVVCLSRESGVWDELSEHVVGVNPFDVSGTADALERALRLDPADRSERAAALRAAAGATTPDDWLAAQLAAAQSS